MDRRTFLFILFAIVSITVDLGLLKLKNSSRIVIAPRSPTILISELPSPVVPITPAVEKVEPDWVYDLPLRAVSNLGIVLSDIDSHMPAGHIYRSNDRVTWAHETTHGINARLRDKFKLQGHINVFYCLQNKAAMVLEPKTKISRVIERIPRILRVSPTYQTYFIQQRSSWNNEPLYICDEWVSYTNGSEVQQELKIQDRRDTLKFMAHFDIYALALAKSIKEDDPGYDDQQFKKFLMWNLERSIRLIGSDEEANQHLSLLRTGADADIVALREFAKNYLGTAWTAKFLGF